MQELEARLLLYAVGLGAGLGLMVMLRRRARSFWFHALLLGVLLAATGWALLDPVRTLVLAVPLFTAFTVLSLAPSLLLMAARRLVGERRFGGARWLSALAAALLGFPEPTRAEATLYSALHDADRGERERAERRLADLLARRLLPTGWGGPAIVRAVPAAYAGDWDAVRNALDDHPSNAPLALGLGARAAAETGDLRRALRGWRGVLARPRLTTLHAQTARVVLAAAGRLDFLRSAVADGLPVMSVSRGPRDLFLARAAEARGELAIAAELYEAAERRTRRSLRRAAADGRARIVAGRPRLAAPDPEEMDEILALEALCRAPAAAGSRGVSHVVWAVPLLSLLALIVSVVTFVFVGDDGDRFSAGVLELLLGGALSAPMIRADGEWWRLFSTMNLHGGWVHLLMNLGSILLIGWPLERRLGWARTAVVYIGSGVLGSLASVYVNDTSVGVGASGAAMGLIGALVVLLLARARSFETAERKRWLFVLWLCIAATAAIGIAEHRFIDNAAHGVGLAAGALLAWPLLPLRPGADAREPGRLAGLVRVAAVVLLGMLVWSQVAAYRASRPVHVEEGGVRAELLGLLRPRPHPLGGVIADRPPLEVRVYLGREPRDRPSALRVLPEGGGPRRVFLRRYADVDVGSEPLVVRPRDAVDVADLGEDFPFGLRIERISNGPAFALLLLPAGPGVTEVYGPLVDSIRTTLAPMR